MQLQVRLTVQQKTLSLSIPKQQHVLNHAVGDDETMLYVCTKQLSILLTVMKYDGNRNLAELLYVRVITTVSVLMEVIPGDYTVDMEVSPIKFIWNDSEDCLDNVHPGEV